MNAQGIPYGESTPGNVTLNASGRLLRQLNVVPLANRDRNGWIGGSALRATF